MTNNLLILFSTLHPEYYNTKNYHISEHEYMNSLKSILKIFPNFILYDNSIDNISEIELTELKNLLFKQHDNFPVYDLYFKFKKIKSINSNIAYTKFIINTEALIEKSSYDYFTFFSLRRLMTSNYYFEKLDTLSKSNYDGYFVNNGRFDNPTLENYNLVTDCLFTMKKKHVLDYINFLKKCNLNPHKDSEYYLNYFLKEKELKYIILQNVGIVENVDYRNFSNSNLIIY